MGMVASLYRFEKIELEKIRKEKKVNFDNCLETYYVDKFWEPIMFIFGNGFIGKEPFVNIFMPINKIDFCEDPEPWSEHIRYHSFDNIIEMNSKMNEVTEALVKERIDIEKINGKVMYQIMSDQTVPTLIDHVMNVKNFFANTNEHQIIISGVE